MLTHTHSHNSLMRTFLFRHLKPYPIDYCAHKPNRLLKTAISCNVIIACCSCCSTGLSIKFPTQVLNLFSYQLPWSALYYPFPVNIVISFSCCLLPFPVVSLSHSLTFCHVLLFTSINIVHIYLCIFILYTRVVTVVGHTVSLLNRLEYKLLNWNLSSCHIQTLTYYFNLQLQDVHQKSPPMKDHRF